MAIHRRGAVGRPGACMLAWCAPQRPTRLWGWGFRLACGLGMALAARFIFDSFPEVFLPLYSALKSQYADFQSNPNLQRLVNDNRAAILHLGLYGGFLTYEILRRDWENVKLILVVGLINGLGWSLCQNWRWAAGFWPDARFNWWRCWESCGGISIGIAYGISYFLVNRRTYEPERTLQGMGLSGRHPNLERLGAYLGLLLGLGLSIKNGLKGWANIYLGNEVYWDRVFSRILGPLVLVCLVAVVARIRLRPVPKDFPGDVFPHAYWLVSLVLLTQNVIAQLVTGPHTNWNETVFSIYYVLLFFLCAVILVHFQFTKVHPFPCDSAREGSAPAVGGSA